jgi:hypothetical protein
MIKMPATSIIIMIPLILLLSSSSIASVLVNYIQPAHAQTFGNPVQFTSPGDQTDSHIAASGNNAYLVMTSEVNGVSNILFTRSTDGGVSYSTPTPLPNVVGSFSIFTINSSIWK